MLLRLKVKNFKNLADVDVAFGPLTCFVGRNGVGKSNLMDAIHFLSLLAEHPIQEAAAQVRRPAEGVFTARDLLRNGDIKEPISLVADLLVPGVVVDDYGREGKPKTTLLRYEVELRYVADATPRLELASERLSHHNKGEARARIGFAHKPAFLNTVVVGERRGGDFISTIKPDAEGRSAARRRRGQPLAAPQIVLHQDGGSRGQPFPPGLSPRTVLGGTNSIEYPTVLAARREMLSWRLLHLEPSAMRAADSFGVTPHVTDRGGHIAATLDALVRAEAERIRLGTGLKTIDERVESGPHAGRSPRVVAAERVLRDATNRLRELDAQVRDLRIDRDEMHQQMVTQLQLTGSEQWVGPRGISDGTLRYLALTVMQMDRAHNGVLCLEEPENGMHPSRIPALVNLIQDYVVDPFHEVGLDNPLRQAIVNTHSPEVVKRLKDEEILFVEEVLGGAGRSAAIYSVSGTWRSKRMSIEGDQPAEHAVPVARVADFIGGAPLGEGWNARQSELRFGTAQ